MADNRNSENDPAGADGCGRRISKKAMNRLDDETIDKLFLRHERDRERRRSWWRRLFGWLTKNQDDKIRRFPPPE
jgi:hypothetical protein